MCSYPLRRLERILVFPDADRCPSGVGQELIGVSISGAILRYLVRPIIGVGLGYSVVLRATVPETSINEYGYLRFCEDEVGAATLVRLERRIVHSETQPERVQGAT